MNKHITIGQLENALKKSRLSVAELSEAIIDALEEVAEKSDSAESALSDELSEKQTAGESVKLNADSEIIFSTGYIYENDILDSAEDKVLDSSKEAIQSSTPIDEAYEPNIIFDKETLTLIIDGKQFSLKLKSEGNIILEAENITASSIILNGVNIGDKISELEDGLSSLEETVGTLAAKINANVYYDV